MPASVQVLPLQHGPSFFPQAWQVLTVVPELLTLEPQARSYVAQPEEVGNVVVGQQGSPALPQPQRPDLHVP